MSFRLMHNVKLLKPSEYSTVFKDGKMARGRYWQVVAKPLETSKPKLGLAISKKVYRLAVDRNRFKRIARETFRLKQQQLDNWGFVVMVRKSKPVKNPILSAELLDLFKKVVRK